MYCGRENLRLFKMQTGKFFCLGWAKRNKVLLTMLMIPEVS